MHAALGWVVGEVLGGLALLFVTSKLSMRG
jgi:hypothetical protein